MYPNIYSDEVALQNQNHFNTVGCPPGLHTSSCIYCALLQHADLNEAHRQKYNWSHLIVLQGAQYKTLLLEITMLCNHRGCSLIFTVGNPFPWSQWETSAWRTRSSLACQGTASCSMVMNSPNFKRRDTMSPPTERRSHLPLALRRKSLHPPMPWEMCPV